MADKYNFLNFTLIDFETNGLDPRVDQIVEAMVIRVRDGNPVSTFNTLVALREGNKMPKGMPHPHIEEDLIGAMSEQELAYVMFALIPERETIVAYNALFDLSFLNALYNREFYTEGDGTDYELPNPFLDPLTIARDREPYPHKLGDVCKRNGIELEDAHSAEADTFALLEVVMKYHRDKDISEWVNVAGYRPKYGEPSWYPAHAILKKQGAEHVNHSPKRTAVPPRTSGTVMTSNRKKRTPPPGDKQEDLP